MASNPDNAIGTNGAYGGRTSVNAANDVLGIFQGRGVLSGWAATPNTGLTISLGGNGTTRDVAIAEDNAGNKTTIDNISQDPVDVTIPAAPASNSRIDLVVAYVDNPPQGVSTELDNPGACGLIVVSGTAASTPVAPNDAAIRSAITADGATGAQAYYAILCKVTIPTGTTTLTSDMLETGAQPVASQPISIKSVSLPYALTGTLTRVGNLVTFSLPPQTNSAFPTTGVDDAGETIPAGFRPAEDQRVGMPSVYSGGRKGAAGFNLNANGSITWWANFEGGGNWWPAANATWITNDPWPTN